MHGKLSKMLSGLIHLHNVMKDKRFPKDNVNFFLHKNTWMETPAIKSLSM